MNVLTRMMLCVVSGMAVITMSGCAVIVKDDLRNSYYGTTQENGSQYLQQVLDAQQLDQKRPPAK